jgi:glutathione synthase/RimK-type ligase-like ATP-grasp enzyme
MKVRIKNSVVNEVAQGLYTYWKINKRSKIERFIDSITLSSGRNIIKNDAEMKIDMDSCYLKISTMKDTVNIHSVKDKETEDVLLINESIEIADCKNRLSFVKEFRDILNQE